MAHGFHENNLFSDSDINPRKGRTSSADFKSAMCRRRVKRHIVSSEIEDYK